MSDHPQFPSVHQSVNIDPSTTTALADASDRFTHAVKTILGNTAKVRVFVDNSAAAEAVATPDLAETPETDCGEALVDKYPRLVEVVEQLALARAMAYKMDVDDPDDLAFDAALALDIMEAE